MLDLLRRFTPHLWIAAALLIAAAAAISLPGIVHTVSLLTQLSTFNHGRCDAILQRRNIEIASNAYLPFKGVGERNGVYEGLTFLSTWLVGVTIFLFGSWGTSKKWGRIQTALAFFFLVGSGMLLAHLEGMGDYVSICEQLLRSSAATVPDTANQVPNPLSMVLILGGLVGALIAIIRSRMKTPSTGEKST